MLLMVEEGIRSGICQAVDRYAKANNKYMDNYVKNIISLVFRCKQLPINDFKWVEDLSQFNEKFVKS